MLNFELLMKRFRDEKAGKILTCLICFLSLMHADHNRRVCAQEEMLKVISWDQGDKHVGETVIVCGPVAFADRINLTRNSAALILGGGPVDRPNAFKDDRRFKVVFLDYHDGFDQNIKEKYLGNSVCVAGTVIWAMAGGVEILPMVPSQVAMQSEPLPFMPRGHVMDIPQGALSFEQAVNHIGENKTVCGVAVAARADVPPNKTLNQNFNIPPKVKASIPEGSVLWADSRVKHRVVIGDFSKFEMFIPVEKADGLPDNVVEYFLNKELCATGNIEFTPQLGAAITVEDLSNLVILK